MPSPRSKSHASVYMLEIDDDSRLGSEILLGGKRYGAFDVPYDDRIADFYETAVVRLARHGIVRYEISNFARPGAESLHNLKYWRREPYLGFGSDAHSFDGALAGRMWNRRGSMWRDPERGESVRSDSTSPDPARRKVLCGLRGLPKVSMPNEQDWHRYGAPSNISLPREFWNARTAICA